MPSPPVSTELLSRMVRLRRDLHQHPERSWQEEGSAARVEAELRSLGLTPRRIAKTGVVVDVPGQRTQPLVALRADLDALPIQEETGLPFASQSPGLMHACAHDGHSAIAVGAAALLIADPPPLPVRILFQPAEEVAQGARALLAEGALEGVVRIFGGHIDRHYPAGTIAVQPGAMNASTDVFFITVRGRDGHGARPHEALDAVVVGSLLVTALQTIVSREIDPAHPSVITVGSFHAGTAANVIAGQAELSGTIRAQHPDVRSHLHASLRRIASAIGLLHGAQVETRIVEGTPPLLNPPDMAALAREAAAAICGPEHVVDLRTVNMGGEDFAVYLEHIAGAYVRIGGRVSGREGFPAHSSRFDFDEAALGFGAAYFAQIARLAAQRLLDEARS